MLLYYATCFVGKVCSAMWSTWGASPWEGKSGAEVGIVNRKVARWVPPGKHSPIFIPPHYGDPKKVGIMQAW